MKLLCAQPILARTPLLAHPCPPLRSCPACLPASYVELSRLWYICLAWRGVASPLFRVYPVAALKIVSLFAFLCLLPTVVGVGVCLRVCVCVSVCACCSLYDLQLCRAVCAMLIECALLLVGQPSVHTLHTPHTHPTLSTFQSPTPTHCPSSRLFVSRLVVRIFCLLQL